MSDVPPRDPTEVTTRAELAAALTVLRVRAGLTVRELARRLDVPSGTLGDYFSGRHVPSASSIPLVRSILAACGATDPAEVERWIDAVARVRASSDRRGGRPITAAPYRGLRAFQPEDADTFFGREDETEAVLGRLRELRADPGPSAGILFVLGPSGSGKSSLLRAGVVARIRAGALDEDGTPAACPVITPGRDPLPTFREALAARPAVVVIDQFEETFTAVADPAQRADFLDAISARDPRVPVVIGMRADFYATAAGEPLLLAALQHAQVLVGPLSREQISQAIVRPAAHAGTRVDDGLVDLILADLAPRVAPGFAHDAGALPLLSHALLATWERSPADRLTIADYRTIGGLTGAVQQTAEDLYAGLDPDEQALARRMLLRLVNLDGDVAVTRRRVTPDELAQLVAGDGPDVHAVLDRFVERRLLTADANSVEITHEALLTAWPRLRGWVDLDRAGLRLHRQITDGANAWQEAGGDTGLLLRGARLETAREWADDPDHAAELNQVERSFLDTASAEQQRERERDRRRRRRLSQALVTVAVLALVAVLLAAYAFRARSESDRQRRLASVARDNALSRQVSFQSRDLSGPDPALAEQLALAAFRISPSSEARGALIDQSSRPVITRILGTPGPTALAVSRDGSTLAVGHADDGSVHLYRTRPGAPPVPIGTVPGGGRRNHQVFALAFTPDGQTLAVGGQAARIALWSISTPAQPQQLATLSPGFTGAVQSIVISPDGRTLVTASVGPHPIVEWDVSAPSSPVPVPAPRGVPATETIQALAFSPHGDRLAAGGTDGTLLVWPAATADRTAPIALPTPRTTTVTALSFDPRRPWLYAGDRRGIVTVWQPVGPAGHVVHTVSGSTDSPVDVVAVSPNGRRLAVGSSDSTLAQFGTDDWTQRSTVENPGPVTGADYSPDGSSLITTAADGALRLLNASTRTIPVVGSVFNLGYSHDGSRLAVGTNGDHGAIALWNARNPARPVRLGPPVSMPAAQVPLDGSGALRSDGRLVAGGNSAGKVELWDETDPARPRPTTAPFQAADALIEGTAFSPDGRLLAVASDDHTARVWDVHDPAHPRRLATVRGGDLMLSVAFSRDGRLLAGANADDTARVWDVSTPARPHPVAALGGFKSYVYGVAFSPTDNTLAATSSDDTTRLWSLRDPAKPTPVGRPLIGPTDYVYAAAFSPDGARLAVASNDRTVRLYTIGDGARRVPDVTLRGAGSPVFSVAFSPDGRTVVAGGRAATLAVWTLDAAVYARQLCPLVGDRITRAEWELYVPGAAYNPPCG